MQADGFRLAAIQLQYAPNGVSLQDNLWLADEPLLIDDPLSVLGPSIRELFGLPNYEHLLATSRRLYLDQYDLRLKQVLDFCADESVDVVVFPEYSIPPELVGTLAGYSSRLSIYAGVGRLREDDAQLLKAYVDAADAIHKNAAIYLPRGGQAELVTKTHLAEGERVEVGDGPRFVTLEKEDRRLTLGLYICLDFLSDDEALDSSAPQIDVALTTALSKTSRDFVDQVPRDYARVFANHAYYGGTSISVPALSAVAFASNRGVSPLPAGQEGIVVVDYEGFPKKPTGRRGPHNRLVARAGFVYEDEDSDEIAESVSRVAADLIEMRADDYSRGAYREYLSRAKSVLTNRSDHPILIETADALIRNQGSGTITQDELSALTKQAVLQDVLTFAEVRYRQIEFILEAIRSHMLDESPGIGVFRDEYLATKQALLSRVRLTHRSSRDRRVGGAAGGKPPSESGPWHRVFAVRLGGYDPVEAVRTLPLQLAVLRNMAAYHGGRIEIAYRISTSTTLGDELVPFFDVVAVARDMSPTDLAGLQEGLGQQLGQAYSRAWNVSGTSAAIEVTKEWQVELVPTEDGWSPTIREDWASVIDLVRTQQVPIEVEIRCSRTVDAEAERTARPAGGGVVDAASAGYLDEPDRLAAEFFKRIADESIEEPRRLVLRVIVGGAAPLPDTLVRAIGLQVFGTPAFEINRLPGPRKTGPPLTPSQAIRIFHPPHGRVEGRGLSRKRGGSVSLPVIPLPATGVTVGTARSSSAREDRLVDIHLDDEARLRHLYIVGRTGSGKTNLLKNLARQDIAGGAGIAVIDPHGDLVDYLLRHVAGRKSDVTLLDFGLEEFTPVLNPLDLDVDVRSRTGQRFAIDEFIRILIRQSFHQFYGPRFEDIVRLTLESVVRAELTEVPSVLDVPRILRNKAHRRALRDAVAADADLRDRWDNFEAQSSTDIAELLHWTLAKFSDMDADGVLASVLAGGKSTVSLSRIVEDGGILLVRLPEWQIGPAAAGFLGALIQERIRRAAFERLRRSAGPRAIQPFYVYVDEFQRFATSGFESLVAEARKFGLGLVLAHQNLRQLEEFSRFTGGSSRELVESIFGNVASFVVLGSSPSDSDYLARALGVPQQVIEGIPRHAGLARMLFGGVDSPPFTIDIPSADADRGLPASRDGVVTEMKSRRLWLPREEVLARLDEGAKALAARAVAAPPSSSFLDEFLRKRAEAGEESGPGARRIARAGDAPKQMPPVRGGRDDTRSELPASKTPSRKSGVKPRTGGANRDQAIGDEDVGGPSPGRRRGVAGKRAVETGTARKMPGKEGGHAVSGDVIPPTVAAEKRGGRGDPSEAGNSPRERVRAEPRAAKPSRKGSDSRKK